MRGAHDNTCRFEPDLNSVIAKIALIRNVGVWVDVDRVVWACIHARLAADADVVIEVDNSVAGADVAHLSGRSSCMERHRSGCIA